MNGVAVLLDPVRGRGEDHDVTTLVGIEPGGQLVDEDVLVGLQRVLHGHLFDHVRLGDEGLDDDEDDQRQDERLDDLEEAPEEGSASHKAAV